MRIQLLTLIATIGFIASATVSAADTATTVAPQDEMQSSQTGVWTPRKLLNFSSDRPNLVPSAGVTCDVQKGEVRLMLLALGARASDLNLDPHTCGFSATFSVLVPADKPEASGTTVATRWQFHQWKEPLNCLEVAYVAQNVPPLFSTKDVQLFSKADCRRNGVGLRAKFLTLADSP
jgi:hypothetical protein